MSDQRVRLRFNCYLLKSSLANPVHSLQAKYRPGEKQELKQLAPTGAAPEGALCFLGASEPKQPPWAAEIGGFFTGTDTVENVANRLVIFMPVGVRWFAVCFGYGSSALDWDAVEGNFGLKVAARTFKSDGLVEVRSRRIDSSSRTQSVSTPAGGSLDDLEVSFDGEFARKLIGRLIDDEGSSGAVSAGDSIIFRSEVDLAAVQARLSGMLDTVTSEQAHDDFAFIDALEMLRAKSKKANALEQLLADTLLLNQEGSSADDGFESHVLQFAPPDDVTLEHVDRFEMSRGDKTATFDDPSLAALRGALAELGVRRGKAFLRDVKVIAVGADAVPASKLLPLRHWLVFEASQAQVRYVLTLGRWFSIATSFTERLDKDLEKIPDVTEALGLLEWQAVWGEAKYNLAAAEDRFDLVTLDRKLVNTDAHGKFELCDLFHVGGDLIHVKRYTGSQTLSHLFSQGAVAAEVLVDETVKTQFLELVDAAGSQELLNAAQGSPSRVTYAIAVEGDRELPSGLPTFSKVNLRAHAKRLRAMQVRPAIARVQIVDEEHGPPKGG